MKWRDEIKGGAEGGFTVSIAETQGDGGAVFVIADAADVGASVVGTLGWLLGLLPKLRIAAMPPPPRLASRFNGLRSNLLVKERIDCVA